MTAPFFVGNTVLCTERLLLRIPRASDEADVCELLTVDDAGATAGWPVRDEGEARRLLIQWMRDNHTFAILARDTGRVIGILDLRAPRRIFEVSNDDPGREVVFVLASDKQDRERMAEALDAAAWYLFTYTDTAVLFAFSPEENRRACRVLEKTGFWQMGDASRWQLIRADFRVKEIPLVVQ